MRNEKYYLKRFKNVPKRLIKLTYKKDRWILEILDRSLINTSKCYMNYYKFLSTKMRLIGEKGIRQIMDEDIPVFDFIHEHEKMRKLSEKVS